MAEIFPGPQNFKHNRSRTAKPKQSAQSMAPITMRIQSHQRSAGAATVEIAGISINNISADNQFKKIQKIF